MTSILTQSRSFDGNTTLSNSPRDFTAMATTEQFSTANILSTPSSNDSYDSESYLLGKPHHIDEDLPDHTDGNFITQIVCSVLVIALLITISILVVFRRYKHSHKQQKTRKQCVQNERNYAHPFEEVLIIPDEPKAMELTQMSPTTTTN